jgi:hypothetical protein
MNIYINIHIHICIYVYIHRRTASLFLPITQGYLPIYLLMFNRPHLNHNMSSLNLFLFKVRIYVCMYTYMFILFEPLPIQGQNMYIYMYAYIYNMSCLNLFLSKVFLDFYVFLVMPYWLGLCVLRTHIESRFCNPHVVIFA